MNGALAGHIWITGFVVTVVLFVTSYLFAKWKRCVVFVKSRFLRQGSYDYKNIFKNYLRHINSIHDKRSLYQTILHVVAEVISSKDISLLLKEDDGYAIKESLGSKPVSFQVGDIVEFLNWLAKFGHTVSRHQLVNKKAFAKIKGAGLHYCVQFHVEACVPIFSGSELLGVLNIGSRLNGEMFDVAARELLDILSGQMSVAIRNASLYEDMARRNVKLQELGRLKSQLLSNMSHELRTPLNSIIGLAELVATGGDGPLNTEQHDHIGMITSSGKRLLDTVSSMLDLAKLEANHLSLNVKRVNLQKLISKIVKGVVPGNKLTLKLSIKDDAPSIYGDEIWLHKLFAHVLDNAVKYTASGEIVVDAERAGEMLKVGIHDTGIGISPEKQAVVFNDFTQANGEADRPYEGAGIGLAISKRIVELHGGRIWLSSSPGRGSHFFITLPLKPTTIKSVELAS